MKKTPVIAALLALVAMGIHAEPPTPQALLSAAQSAADGGDYRRAEALLNGVDESQLAAAAQAQLHILRAQMLLARNEPAEALKWLSLAAPQPAQIAAQLHWLRAQALFRVGNGPGATYELVQRERFLSPTQLAENRDAIWAGLFQIPMDTEVLSRLKNLDDVTAGWVELAVLVRERSNLDDWRLRHPGHPGELRIAGVASAPAASASAPRRLFGLLPARPSSDNVALLLPLSGAFSATAEAVRDGYLSAYYRSKSGARPGVRIYDAGASTATTISAYRQALDDGAGLVIGPLRKDALSAVVELGQPGVPVLALNYLDSTQPVFNLFQVGLAPEDEARAAAERAFAEGGRRALALVPSADWGERALAAFSARLRELGGSVSASARYAVGARDFAPQIKQLLGVDASEARHRALSNTLGRNTEFDARRRDDIDFIFIAARPAEGRMIWPQLRYYGSSGLPVYATSLVYDGGVDTELNGLRFCDMPWMLDTTSAPLNSARSDATAFASAKAQPRLYALGQDAFLLANMVQKGDLQSGSGYLGATGELRLNGGGVIARRLDCAQIDSGRPRALGAVAAP